jgi:YVTN family beta-propeller protein
VEFRILGPLEVVEEGESLAVAAGKQRALLAMLLLRANEVVSTDALIDGLWGDQPPASAPKSLQIYISHLRKIVGNAALVTRPPGYELRVSEGELDLEHFERLVDEGKNALASGNSKEAATRLREALSLWRGEPLADFSYEPFAQSEIARLEELRLSAVEERIDADLALGRHSDLIGELEALVKQHPLRERLRGQLMLALYRCGRQAEALDLYHQTRKLLRNELGLEPSPALQELEQGILRQDSSLAAPPRTATSGVSLSTARGRPAGLILVGVILLLAAVAAVIVALSHGAGARGLPGLAPNSLGAIDPKTSQIVAQVGVGTRPSQMVYGSGALWVMNQGDNTISRVDPVARAQVRVIPLGGVPVGIAAGRGSIWVTTDKDIKVIAPAFDDLARTIKVREQTPSIVSPFVTSPTGIAFTRGALWVINGDLGGRILRLDTKTGRRLDEITTGNDPAAIVSSGGDLWVTDALDNTVSSVDSTGAVTPPVKVGKAPTSIAVGGGAVWVADSADDDVKRIDPNSGAVVTTIPVGHSPSAIAIAGGAVWVANRDDGTISRIDPHSNEVVKTIEIGGSPIGLAAARGLLWASVRAKPPVANSALESQGGVAQIDWGPFSIDPASQDTFDALTAQLEYATCAKLLNYPDKPAPEGSRLQPEVAKSMPTISPDGKIYAFTIRSGYRFSPPSNQPVTAATFKYTIERSLNPNLKSPGSQFLNDIVGEQAYRKGQAAHIAGVTVHGNALSIRLVHASADLPAVLAMPFFCAVPTNTPMHLTESPPIPTAGPYYIASNTPGAQTILKRNPNYTGPRPHRLAEIIYAGEYSSEHNTTRSVARVFAGETDYVPVVGGIEAGAWSIRTKLNRRYGVNTPAARSHHQQAFLNPFPSVDALTLNTSRGLFGDPRLRRAVNYAIDRRALARLGGFGFAGPLTAAPTDQYLPPNFPGFKDVKIYPLGGDLREAKRLAGRRRRTAVMYTCDFSPCPQEAQLVKRTLAALGITVEVRTFPISTVFKREFTKGEPFDIGLVTWREDYADPYDFLNLMFDGSLGVNVAQFDKPSWNHRLEAAARLFGKQRYRAYARLDADLVRQAAPWVAFENETNFDFFSARIGCQTYQPIYGMDIAALCKRPA